MNIGCNKYGGNRFFSHIIGPPKKDGIEKPFCDYE
jgi:hypothetical protein